MYKICVCSVGFFCFSCVSVWKTIVSHTVRRWASTFSSLPKRLRERATVRRLSASLVSISHKRTLTRSTLVKYVHLEVFCSIPDTTSTRTHNLLPLFVRFGSAALCGSSPRGDFIQYGTKWHIPLSYHTQIPHSHLPPQSGPDSLFRVEATSPLHTHLQ